MFDGIEVDVLSLGDADCIIVTKWQGIYAHRVLIDGGCATDADKVLDFLLSRGYTDFWAAVCTHPHKDHARGLIKIVQSGKIAISNAWMHDIRNHIGAEILSRACSSSDEVKELVETTRELAAAFLRRGLQPKEPFAGECIAGFPSMMVLGPSVPFYRKILGGFVNTKDSIRPQLPGLRGFRANSPHAFPSLPSVIPYEIPKYTTLATLLSSPSRFSGLSVPVPPLAGLLNKSSVKENPTTQPFNETSVILGVTSAKDNLLFTGDAGSGALAFVSADWNHLLYMGVPHHGSDGNLSQGDIERFCPRFAIISARGDLSHPSRAILNGLAKVGTKLASTHISGNLWFWSGSVPARSDYGPTKLLKGNVDSQSAIDWSKIAAAAGVK